MEERITFQSETYDLEGLFDLNGSSGLIVTHPHPLYGGQMDNPVVDSVRRAYRQHGYTTLRFNFRGTGNSQGRFADGVGEQADVRAAVNYLFAAGIKDVVLAGYSFGAWINALTVQQEIPIKHLIMVSPPVGFIDFQGVSTIPGLQLVVTGSRDEIAPVKRIEQLLPSWNPAASFEVISGAYHFYGGYIDQLESVLAAHIEVS
jgi:alpha/beta superfamily hydrolase